MARAGEYSRLVAGKRVKAFFSESGELEYLEVDGNVFEGVGDFAPVPLWRLRRLKLGEIPEEVLIQPVEGVERNIIYSIGLGKRASFEVKVGKGFAILEMNEWPQDWEGAIGFFTYVNSLADLLRELERMNVVHDLEAELADELFTLSFTLRLSENLTVLNALRILKRFIRVLEEEAEYRAAEQALKEARRILKRRQSKRKKSSFYSQVSRVLEETAPF
ncbi:MAG: hypothetical protein QXU72_02120 [Thermofilum sp.]